jgi:hypothetical protein
VAGRTPEGATPASGDAGGRGRAGRSLERTGSEVRLRSGPPGDAGGAWAARPLLSLSSPGSCTHALLAGDGRRCVIVGILVALEAPGPGGQQATLTPSAPACRLLVLDLAGPAPAAAARPARDLARCPRDTVLTAVAASDGPEGPLVHVGLWRGPRPGRPERPSSGTRRAAARTQRATTRTVPRMP